MSHARFRTLLEKERTILTELCETWEVYLNADDDDVDDDDGPPSARTRSKTAEATAAPKTVDAEKEEMDDATIGRIRATTGQGRMLIRERFVQFERLIDDSEFNRGEKYIGDEDLQGFWDMIGFQVDDMKEKFEALELAKQNKWKQQPKQAAKAKAAPPKAKKKDNKTTTTSSSSKTRRGPRPNVRDFIAKKRQENREQQVMEDKFAGLVME